VRNQVTRSPGHQVTGKGKIFIVSAPSGCGKTTLCGKLLKGRLGLVDSVSMTTRLPRPGERDGVDYHFVSGREFRALVAQGGFLEHEENFGSLYGTPKKLIEENVRRGVPTLLSIDVKGAMKVRRLYPKESVLIFIAPPSLAALKKRLVSRRSESADAVMARLKIAKKELSYKSTYDYTIVNDTLAHAYRRLKRIITAEMERGGQGWKCHRSISSSKRQGARINW